jgi:hypothetical protein
LLEVIGLALVDAIKNEIGLLIAHALHDRSEIGGAVHGRAFGRNHEQRIRAFDFDDRAVVALFLFGLAGIGDAKDARALVVFEQDPSCRDLRPSLGSADRRRFRQAKDRSPRRGEAKSRFCAAIETSCIAFQIVR